AQAPNIQTWIRSGFIPVEVFKHARALTRGGHPEARPKLCEILGALPPGDLAIFEEAITDVLHGKKDFDCLAPLAARISADSTATSAAGPTGKGAFQIVSVNISNRGSPRAEEQFQLPAGQFALTFDGGPVAGRTEQ